MKHFSAIKLLASGCLVMGLSVALTACGSDSGGGNSGGNGGSGQGGSGQGGSGQGGSGQGGSGQGGSGNTCQVLCDDGCPNIACFCNSGAVINSTYCDNGCCASEAVTCTDACADEDGWGGGQGGSGQGGSGQGGSGQGGSGQGGSGQGGGDVGDSCRDDSECSTRLCLFDSAGSVVGYCTKPCGSFADCPTFWDCAEVSNGSGTYCVQDN
ncbi:MAG: hypothetical protein R3B07_29900 [Polyangiaceae bacterium]